jgi:hypothetical protein
MLTTNAPLAVLVTDRLNLFFEIEAIAVDLTMYERWNGSCADSDDMRQRLATLRRLVLVQLLALIDELAARHTVVH